MHGQSFFGPAFIEKGNYVLASHKRLPVRMDNPTADTGVSSRRTLNRLRRSKVALAPYQGTGLRLVWRARLYRLRSHGRRSRRLKGCGLPEVQSDFIEIYESKTFEVYIVPIPVVPRLD